MVWGNCQKSHELTIPTGGYAGLFRSSRTNADRLAFAVRQALKGLVQRQIVRRIGISPLQGIAQIGGCARHKQYGLPRLFVKLRAERTHVTRAFLGEIKPFVAGYRRRVRKDNETVFGCHHGGSVVA